MDNIQKKHVDTIREAKRQNRLVVFVGSGVSANSGVPTWASLITSLQRDLPKDLSQEDDALKEKVKEYIRHDETGKLNYNLFFDKQFGITFGKEFGVKFGIKFGDNEKQLLLSLNSNPGMTAQDLADYLGITKRAVEKQIKKLRELNVLTRQGSAKNGLWVINRKDIQ